MKKINKKLITPIIVLCAFFIITIINIAPDIYRRLFGNEAEKSFYRIDKIINSYNLDIADHSFFASCLVGGGMINTEKEILKYDDYYKFNYYIGIDSSFIDDIYRNKISGEGSIKWYRLQQKAFSLHNPALQ